MTFACDSLSDVWIISYHTITRKKAAERETEREREKESGRERVGQEHLPSSSMYI